MGNYLYRPHFISAQHPSVSRKSAVFKKEEKKIFFSTFGKVLAAVFLFSEANVFAERERERGREWGSQFFPPPSHTSENFLLRLLRKKSQNKNKTPPYHPHATTSLIFPTENEGRRKNCFLIQSAKERERGECANIPFPHHYIPDLFPLFPTHPPKSFLFFFSGGNIHSPSSTCLRAAVLTICRKRAFSVSQLCRSMTSFFFFGRKCNSYFLFSLFSLSRSFPFLPFSSAISSRPLHPPSISPIPTPSGMRENIHQNVHIMLQKVGFFYLSQRDCAEFIFFAWQKCQISFLPSSFRTIPSLHCRCSLCAKSYCMTKAK